MNSYSRLSYVYDALMSDVDYKKWAAFLDIYLKKYGMRRIFETACGTGGITKELIRLGYEITASDVSPDMLRKAKENARESGLCANFILQDMRNIEVGNKADAVLCACDGLNYLDIKGASRFFSSAYNALKEGGILLFDISTAKKLIKMGGEVYFDDRDDVSCIWSGAYDETKGALITDVTVFIRSGDLYERFDERHVQYAHSTEKLQSAVVCAGFKNANAYEFPDFSGSKQRTLFVCEK